jgi:hypothetical protein
VLTLKSYQSGNRFSKLLENEFTVILLRGKNTKGDQIYCYVKITLPNVQRFKAALRSHNAFNPSDFGTVVAAGKGEPPREVQAEIRKKYALVPENVDLPPAKEKGPGKPAKEKKP